MNALTGLVLISDSFTSSTNIRYLTNFTAPDPVLFMKTTKADYLVVSSMEKGRAESEAKEGTHVLTPSDLGLKGKKAGKRIEQIIRLIQTAGIRHIQVTNDFPAGLYQRLINKGINVSVCSKPICTERRVKSADEIAKIKKSQQAAVVAMKAAINLIASAEIAKNNRLRISDGWLTSEKVQQLINTTLINYNCIGSDTIVAGGEQATDPHARGHGKLYAGQAIIIDIFPRSTKTGYWGDITRTVCRGPASPELKKLYLAVKTAQTAALKTVKPGVCGDNVHGVAKKVLEQRGYETKEIKGKHVGFIHGTGHGVGLDIHESPRIGTSGEVLEEGNVVTVEPGLYYPDLGGVRIEDTVVVTNNGIRNLALCPKKFELL